MYYAGIDAHKNYLTIAIVDNQGELLSEEKRVPIGDGEPLVAALEGPRPMEAVVETCPFWPWIHDVIREGTEVGFHLAHASRLDAIAKAETKTDSVDARLLARMLGAGLVPEVYPKLPDQRELCRLVRHRRTLVEERTSLYNRIHSHLQQQGLQVGRGKLRREPGRRWLAQEAWSWLRPEQKALVEGHLELIEHLSDQIEELDGRIRQEAVERPAAGLLQTIPGIGPYRSVLLVAEVTPIERFPSPDHLVSFAGLAPRVSQSGVGEARYGADPGGSQSLGTGRPGVGDPEPRPVDPGELARPVLPTEAGAARHANRPHRGGPEALPSGPCHAVDGRGVAGMSPNHPDSPAVRGRTPDGSCSSDCLFS